MKYDVSCDVRSTVVIRVQYDVTCDVQSTVLFNDNNQNNASSQTKQTKKLRGLSPRANYLGLATGDPDVKTFD
jgi:hypothetical protein